MSFFDEYSYDKEEKRILEKVISDTINLLLENMEDIKADFLLKQKSAYKRIRFQRISIKSAAYTKDKLLNDIEVAAAMNIVGMPLNERVELWDSYSIKEKIAILDLAGKFILLSNTKDFKGLSLSKSFEIVDFNLIDMGNNPYIRNVDYYFENNKLYLLKEKNISPSDKNTDIIMTDIVIDDNKAETGLGQMFSIPFSNSFTKIEYYEILKNFTECMATGSTIQNMSSKFENLVPLKQIHVYDKYNAPETIKGLWGDKNNVGQMNNFDFLVSMPVEYVSDGDKMNCILDFFKVFKPAYANYIISSVLYIEDKISKDDFKSKVVISLIGGTSSFKDVIDIKENNETTIIASLKDIIKTKTLKRRIGESTYDKTFDYDLDSYFDSEKSGESKFLIDYFINGLVQASIDDTIHSDESVYLLNSFFNYDSIELSEKNPEFEVNSTLSDKIEVSTTTNGARFDNVTYCDQEFYTDSIPDDKKDMMMESVQITLL